MNSPFLNGFADELVKEAANPLLEPLVRGTTMLGKKVQGMMSKVVSRAQGIRNTSKGGRGLKSVTTKLSAPASMALFKAAEDGDDDDGDDKGGDANDVLKTIIEEAQARANDQENEQGYNDQLGGVGATEYGTGKGTKARKAGSAATVHDLPKS